jgi:hypothetical protein
MNDPKSVAPKTERVIGGEKVPLAMVNKYNQIAEPIGRFCDEKLNEDLKILCWRALAKLARKRSSPIIAGKPLLWSAGIAYAIGSINFVFDKAQSYYLHSDEFEKWFGISKKSISSKALSVKKLLDLSYFSSEFTIKNINNFFFM